jgi:hypothetical protein
MGSRSRKRRGGAPREPGAPRSPGQPGAPAEPRVRGEERNERIRAELEPLGAGERPKAVVVAAAVAVLIGAANLVLLAAGYDVRGSEQPSAAGAIVFAVIMFVAAAAMWQGRYWAVLGFQCLLAIVGVYAGLSLLLANDLRAVVLCLALIAGSGTLFWFLIRAMARIQMPERPGSVRRHG